MKFVRSLERWISQQIEGFFNKKLYSALQPVEIAKEINLRMEEKKSVSVHKIYVPNNFTVMINSVDYEEIAAYEQQIVQELGSYTALEAKKKNYVLPGCPQIKLVVDVKLMKGCFLVEADFLEAVGSDVAESLEECSENTQVFERCRYSSESNQYKNFYGQLTIIEGADVGMRVKAVRQRINIGRRENNEIPLSDMSTSRLHAYIIYEDNTHIVEDAQSLNGTYVNGQRITYKQLKTGDKIKIGNTVILYEVYK